MSQPLPIACALSARDLGSRITELRALGGDGLLLVTESARRADAIGALLEAFGAKPG
jgi:hypothetical protein